MRTKQAKKGSILNVDPTRSLTLRRSFAQSLTVVFASLKKEIYNLIVVEDAFGLKKDRRPTLNYDYASTQLNVTDKEVKREIERIQATLLPEDVVKLEDTPHITVKYGLLPQETMSQGVRALVSKYGEIGARVGPLSIFKTDKADVLKFDIEGGQLKDLNDRLRLLPNYESHPVYHPHMTVAYLKVGEGEKYIQQSSLTGKSLKFDTLTFFNKEGMSIPLALNKRWKYTTQSEAVEKFGEWVDAQIKSKLLSKTEAAKWKKFITKGFEKGAARAFDDTAKARKQGSEVHSRGEGFVEGKREGFIRTSLSRATAIEKLKLINSNALSEVVGMCDELKLKAKRALTDGLMRGTNPSDIAKRIMDDCDISKGRAETIAFTELVRAHADGQLEAMEQLGVKNVGVAVEWSTATNPCKACEPLKGIVLTIAEARGMIPRHPRCRCAWLPANVGEDKDEKKQQVRPKGRIEKAIARSQKALDSGDDWGPTKDIAKQRPKTVLNVACSCAEIEFDKLITNLFCASVKEDAK